MTEIELLQEILNSVNILIVLLAVISALLFGMLITGVKP